MKTIKKCFTAFIVMLLCLNLNVLVSHADGMTVTIGLSDSEISTGDGVTATVNVSGSDVSAYTIYVSYDSSVLQFNSASGSAQANGGGGALTISGAGAGSVSISFSAIANGTSSISTSGDEAYNINLEQIPISHAGVSVTVATETTEETTEEITETTTESSSTEETTEASTEATTEDTRSSNCNLASLQISPGKLEPEFSYYTTSYFVQVDKDVTSMVVSAYAEDAGAYVEVWGAGLIEPGENTVRVTVTAENGAVKVYNLSVMAGEDLGDPVTTIDGKIYSFVDDEDIEALEGFTQSTLMYEEWEVLAYEAPNKLFKIVPLSLKDSDDDEFNWYIYNEDTNSFSTYNEFSANYVRYVIKNVPEGVILPEGFETTEITINANKVPAFRSDNLHDKSMYLIYAMNLSGGEGFYMYDMAEGSFMRYIPVIIEKETVIMATPTMATATFATPTTYVPVTDQGFFTKDVLVYFLIGAGVLLIIFIIVIICVAGKNKNLKEELEEAESMVEQLTGNVPVEDITEKQSKKEGKKKKEPKVSDVDLFASTFAATEEESPQDRYLRGEEIEDEAHGEEIPTLKIEDKKEESKENASQNEIDYEKQSEIINSKIKENYDASMDSAFAEEVENKTESEETEVPTISEMVESEDIADK